MLRADSAARRQLSLTTPDILWRGQPEREGLVVAAIACANPECPCRDIELKAYRVADWLVGVDLVKGKVEFHLGAEAPEGDVAPILRADLDIDTGIIRLAESAAADMRDESALGWLRDEMDGAFLDHLADKMLLSKGLRPLKRMTVEEAEPGAMVGFPEAYLTGRVDSYILDDRRFDALDLYCVNPSCGCTDMRFNVFRDGQDLGCLIVDLGTPAWDFRREGAPLLDKVREVITHRYPDPGPFRQRAKLMKEAGPDIAANARKTPFVAPPAVGRNQPCPCGSGKKYKRCCMARDVT